MEKRRSAVAAVVSAVFGVVLSSMAMADDDGWPKVSSVELKKNSEAAKSAILDRLNDPFSARFKNVKLGKNKNLVQACGEVNAKNGYGAYAGFRRFGILGDQVILDDGKGAHYGVLIDTLCP
ncbi:MAG: hypothetical protein CMK91_05275 [Pseudomonas sp.]|jgi:hypothetical protein|nr:hypothetical protein [Pseudomonas sp.]|tara:strand:+ start:608 stop:973 length:366 start_codon:yes stop_codon:yes gene_type:complete